MVCCLNPCGCSPASSCLPCAWLSGCCFPSNRYSNLKPVAVAWKSAMPPRLALALLLGCTLPALPDETAPSLGHRAGERPSARTHGGGDAIPVATAQAHKEFGS